MVRKFGYIIYPLYLRCQDNFYIENIPSIMYILIMPTKKPKILITLEGDLLTRIDDFRFENRINSRSEAIRRLIEEGLKASSDPRKASPSSDPSMASAMPPRSGP